MVRSIPFILYLSRTGSLDGREYQNLAISWIKSYPLMEFCAYVNQSKSRVADRYCCAAYAISPTKYNAHNYYWKKLQKKLFLSDKHERHTFYSRIKSH